MAMRDLPTLADRTLGWRILSMRPNPRGELRVALAREGDGAQLELVLSPAGSEPSPLVRTPFGDVSYGKTSLSPGEAAEVARALGAEVARGSSPLLAAFPHLALPRDGSPSSAARALLSASVSRALPSAEGGPATVSAADVLYFDPPGLAAHLAPELSLDGEPYCGYVLRAITLPPVARRESTHFDCYLLELEHDDDGSSLQLLVGAVGRVPQVFGRVGPLEVGVRHHGRGGQQDELAAQVGHFAAWLLALLACKQERGLRLDVPRTEADMRAMSVPQRALALHDEDATPSEASGPPQALNLAIDADCGQACVFCSVKSYMPPSDDGDAELQRHVLALRRASELGIAHLRINGIDPLAFSRILPLVEAARALSFSRVDVYSTGRALASSDFRRALLERGPPGLRVVIPLYGVTPAVHDAVTGRPGAHAEATAAIDGMLADAGPARVGLSSVVVKQNQHEVPALVLHARKLGLEYELHLPYPMRQTARDPYADSALREEEVVAGLLRGLESVAGALHTDVLRRLAGFMPHPCVLWRSAERTSELRAAVVEAGDPRILDGTHYRSDDFVHAPGEASDGSAFAVATVPCAHRARCALAPQCASEHYAVYRDLFGLSAFAPVSVKEIYDEANSRERQRERS